MNLLHPLDRGMLLRLVETLKRRGLDDERYLRMPQLTLQRMICWSDLLGTTPRWCLLLDRWTLLLHTHADPRVGESPSKGAPRSDVLRTAIRRGMFTIRYSRARVNRVILPIQSSIITTRQMKSD